MYYVDFLMFMLDYLRTVLVNKAYAQTRVPTCIQNEIQGLVQDFQGHRH